MIDPCKYLTNSKYTLAKAHSSSTIALTFYSIPGQFQLQPSISICIYFGPILHAFRPKFPNAYFQCHVGQRVWQRLFLLRRAILWSLRSTRSEIAKLQPLQLALLRSVRKSIQGTDLGDLHNWQYALLILASLCDVHDSAVQFCQDSICKSCGAFW